MSPNIVKLGGLAGILAAALFLIAAVIEQVAPIQRVYDSPNEYVYSAVSMGPSWPRSLRSSGCGR